MRHYSGFPKEKKYKTRGYKKALNITKGYNNRYLGRSVERYFENQLKAQNVLWFKIFSPNWKTKDTGSQVCDYILILSDGLPFFVDTKSLNKKPTLSFFFPPQGKDEGLTATQKQFSKFSMMYEKDFVRSGFIFKKVEFDNDEMFFMPTKMIRHAKGNEDLILQKIDRLDSLVDLC